ncbi:MAG TPA: GAF domain-containing protein, partial [Anaerolineae bacterium]|nr:GAF domain-containing protein [Anaerolineae bacterium]
MVDRVLTSVKQNRGALRIAVIYLVIGGLWISLTEPLVERLTSDPTLRVTLGLLKGWGYVILTALLLYGLIRRHIAALHESAEEATVREQALMRALMDNVPDSIYFKDTQSRFIRGNRALANKLGVAQAEQVLGKTDFDFFSADHAQAAYADEQTILRTGQPIINREEKETWLHQPPAWVLTTKMPLRDNTGAVVGTFGISRDITERRHLELELRDKVATLQTLAEIDREIIAATEPESALELVCRRAAELMQAPKAAIAITSAINEMTMTASYGLRDPGRLAEELTRAWKSGVLSRRILQTRGVIGLEDILFSDMTKPEIGQGEDTHALVLVPLIAGERFLGVLGVFDTTSHSWAADELQILGMLAGQAAVALEKLRLFQAANSRALQLTTLNEISQALTSSLDLEQVLVTLLEKMRQTADAEACSVALVEQDSGDLVFRQAVGGDAAAVIGLRLERGQGLAGWVALHGQPLLIPNAATDPRAYHVDRNRFVTRDLVAVPLIARNTVIGVLELVNKCNGRFGADDVRL